MSYTDYKIDVSNLLELYNLHVLLSLKVQLCRDEVQVIGLHLFLIWH